MSGCVAYSVDNPRSNMRDGEKEIVLANHSVRTRLEKEFEDELESLNLSLCWGDLKYDRLLRFYSKTGEEILDLDPNRGFKPDGKFLYINDKSDNTPYVLVASEAKTQGTNKCRVKNGKGRQAIGNAVERSSKNLGLMKEFFKNFPFNPYAIFITGSDFSKDSAYGLHRAKEINCGKGINKTHLNLGKGNTAASVYCREDSFTISEIIEVLYPIAKNSLKYYLKNFF